MNKKEITEMITGHCAGVASTQENGLVATKVYIDDLADELVNLFSIHGVSKSLKEKEKQDFELWLKDNCKEADCGRYFYKGEKTLKSTLRDFVYPNLKTNTFNVC
tara:strand:- start:33322 stop:33636 length:315 start_codon:yes stop_codon:yes gene_type:complete